MRAAVRRRQVRLGPRIRAAQAVARHSHSPAVGYGRAGTALYTSPTRSSVIGRSDGARQPRRNRTELAWCAGGGRMNLHGPPHSSPPTTFPVKIGRAHV